MADFSNNYRIEYVDGCCRIHFRCFDTPNSVAIYGVDSYSPSTEDLLLRLRRLCLELHGLWSFSLEGSDLQRVNRDASCIAVDPRTAQLIQAMKDMHACVPLFDFTIGSLSFFWKKATRIPSQEQVDQARLLVGADNVTVEDNVVCKTDPRVRVDVGAFAKGYIADLLVSELREAGVVSADVDLGGNLFMVGSHPSGRPWRVSIAIPAGVAADPIVLEVQDRSVVTSGSYERFVEIEGRRFQHVINPLTGWPAESDFVSATVVSPQSCQADVLATALLIAGSEGFEEFAHRFSDCRFVAITNQGRVLEN